MNLPKQQSANMNTYKTVVHSDTEAFTIITVAKDAEDAELHAINRVKRMGNGVQHVGESVLVHITEGVLAVIKTA